MKTKKDDIFNILLDNKNVNYYTKLLILLSRYSYYYDYYIPNKKIMNTLHISDNNVRRLINKAKEDNIIKVYYKGNRRYFKFINKEEEEKPNVEIGRAHV